MPGRAKTFDMSISSQPRVRIRCFAKRFHSNLISILKAGQDLAKPVDAIPRVLFESLEPTTDIFDCVSMRAL